MNTTLSEPQPVNLPPESRVLPTLDQDGSRRWVHPSLSTGYFWHRRRVTAYALVAFFVTLPHLRMGGRPWVLLDIVRREFTFFGHTFYPTDTPLLALLTLMAFFSVMFVTATAGRVWCGWGCPQTVYLEFLFRPIDRFFAGTIGRGGQAAKPMSTLSRSLRLVVYVACSMFLAHTFLSYFVGTDRLAHWIFSSPLKHPVAFVVMGAATLALLLDFLFFREQFCMIACPYGRFQSVMLDRRSWIISYDAKRGEPRGKSKAASTDARGDCVDCRRCVAVCPTGIDIRHGLQMECINCAQCIDACDKVMTKIGRPTGLVRYTSQDSLEGRRSPWLRARTIVYPLLIAAAGLLFLVVLSTKFAFDARLLRGPGAPFIAVQQEGRTAIQNNIRLHLLNRSPAAHVYSVQVVKPEGVVVEWSEGSDPKLAPNANVLAPLKVSFPTQMTIGMGSREATLIVRDDGGAERSIPFRLVGPR